MENATSDASRVLIIGGGFAGLGCARTLAGDSRFAVTLVDRTNHHLFQPLLYQVATASLAAPDIARSIRQILADAPNVTVLMDEITEIDPAVKHALRPGFSYLDKGIMAIIGKNHAVVKAGKMRLQGLLAWFAWLFIHILFLIGFRNRLSVLLGWAFAYLKDNPEARIIVHPPTATPAPRN